VLAISRASGVRGASVIKSGVSASATRRAKRGAGCARSRIRYGRPAFAAARIAVKRSESLGSRMATGPDESRPLVRSARAHRFAVRLSASYVTASRDPTTAMRSGYRRAWRSKQRGMEWSARSASPSAAALIESRICPSWSSCALPHAAAALVLPIEAACGTDQRWVVRLEELRLWKVCR
jgi:hypothetical protein